MSESDLLIKLLLSVVFGAILGLESDTREIEDKGEKVAKKDEKFRLGGFRTYTLISLFGGIAGVFYILESKIISYILFLTLIILIFIAYYLNVKLKQAFGLTTEIAIIITFVLGFLTSSSLVRFEILLGILVLMAFFLSQKRGIGKFINKIQHKELIDVIKFGLISLILLPIIPNRDFYVKDLSQIIQVDFQEKVGEIYLINPFSIWLVVILISGLNLVSYYLSRAFGTKAGIQITSFFGGFFSSTSTLISLASKAKKSENKTLIKRYSGGAILSNGVSYILAGFLFLISNFQLFREVLPMLVAMFISSVLIGLKFISSKDKINKEDIDKDLLYEPFSVGPAIKFITLILSITIIIQLLQLLNVSETFILFVTAISGLTGIDAPIIAISGLALSENISFESAVLAFVLTNTINLIGKTWYSRLLGNNIFFKYVAIGLGLTVICGLLALIIF